MKISEEEKQLARFSVAEAMKFGASAARASLSKTVSDEYALLEGKLDKVSHTADRSIFMYLYVDGKFGTYSTNRLEKDSLSAFLQQCVSATRLLSEDKYCSLPPKERCAVQSGDGTEMGLFDSHYFDLTSEKRLELAMKTRLSVKEASEDWHVVSCETSYSDCLIDSFLVDSNGVELRDLQTSFLVNSDVTIEDREGNKYNSYWWEGSSSLSGLHGLGECAKTALQRAVRQLHPVKARGGKHTMVVDRNVSSRLFSPILNSLYADSIDQKGSFLCDSLGKKLFPEWLTVMDYAQLKGMSGARLFDSEGVATKDRAIIENGVVKNYFTGTYYANKLGFEPTVNGPSIPTVLPCCEMKGRGKATMPYCEMKDIVAQLDGGILVTGFNGGNCNASTGDFSYGVEGFKIRGGKICEPVKEMLITGNMLELWNNLIAAGTDARYFTRWQIPTLAFKGVQFSA